jgi:hypothetical protein
VIAREQKLVAIKQYCVAARVAGDRNRQQILIESADVGSLKYALDPKSRGAIVGMHYACTAKPFGETAMIRDVIAVR